MTSDSARLLPCDEGTYKVVEESLQSVWQVANKLASLKPPVSPFFRVCIFGSSRIQEGDALYQEVEELAARLARMGCDIVTGGGPGVMEAANRGENRGDPQNATRSYGLNVDLPHEQRSNPFVEKLYRHRTFFTRLHQFVRLSNAFVVMGGGIGTTLELMMVWQLLQVKHLDHVPLIVVGSQWEDLVEWGRSHLVDHDPPLADAGDLDIPHCVEGIEAAIEVIAEHRERWETAREEAEC